MIFFLNLIWKGEKNLTSLAERWSLQCDSSDELLKSDVSFSSSSALFIWISRLKRIPGKFLQRLYSTYRCITSSVVLSFSPYPAAGSSYSPSSSSSSSSSSSLAYFCGWARRHQLPERKKTSHSNSHCILICAFSRTSSFLTVFFLSYTTVTEWALMSLESSWPLYHHDGHSHCSLNTLTYV